MKKKAIQTFLLEFFLSSLAGILLTLPFPKFGLSQVAWISFIPLFMALEGATPRKAFFLGWITGIVHFSTLLSWVTVSMMHYGNLSEATSFFLLILLSSYLGLYVGAFGGLLIFFRNRFCIEPAVIAPVVWTLLEFLRAYLLSGFPWGLLGYSQYQNLFLIQISDITGVYGVSFLIVLANVSLYLIVKWTRFRVNPFPFLYTIVTLGILLSVIFYGHVRIEKIKNANKNSIHLQVSLIQGNIDQAQKWDPAYTNETLATYKSLTVKAAKDHPDLIFWPETAVPCYFSPEHEYGPFFLSLAKKVNAPILFGSLAYEQRSKPEDYKYFNSAFLVSPEDKKVSQYDKVHLVPFGEYVPLKPFLPFVEKMVVGVGDFSPGKNFTLFAIPRARCGVLICYEIIFPNLSRNYCKSGANFLVTITNDAWFGRSSAPYQHFSMAAFRAVENRVFVARAANTGITGFVDPNGKIVKQGGIFKEEAMNGTIRLSNQKTFYTLYGDVFAWACTALSLLLLVKAFFQKP